MSGKFDQQGKYQVATEPKGKGLGWPFPLWDLTLAVKTVAAFNVHFYVFCVHVCRACMPCSVCGGPDSSQDVVLSTVDSGLASGAFLH